ncbi:MAG: LptF/LptG family permease [Crocinitomicaceae bacterium]|nr:LptF/LptG family permease [Crocinitomicaceae bacterium]
MKRIHWFIIRSFIGPFLVTFSIAMFFLIMQFLWKYIDDLMGKGLELSIILEMLFYVSASLIPLALPLAVLFSSIMTFGNLAENNELTALKSAGQSLIKTMRPMLVFVVFLSISAFYFSNYVLPIANLKWRSISWDLLDTKPQFMLREGIFYKEIQGYHIKVDKKTGNSGLEGILIYDFTDNNSRRIIRAKTGEMLKSDTETSESKDSAISDYLFLSLQNGVIYENVTSQKFEKVRVDFQKSFFDEAIIKFDMSGFEMQKNNEDLYKQDHEMMNFIQLDRSLDSLMKLNDSLDIEFQRNLKNNFLILNNSFTALNQSENQDPEEAPETDTIIYLDSIHTGEYNACLAEAQNDIRNVKDQLYHQSFLIEHREASFDQYKSAWHKKFTLSFAILVLFFIGAPLGAIIRKGGLGAPLVFATLFFIFYYILTIAGENMVESSVMSPWSGLWLSTMILTPLGAFLTYKAANDSALFDRDVYKRWFNRVIRRQK